MKKCVICRQNFKPDKYHPFQKYCSKNCISHRPYKDRFYRELKLAAIRAYGGKCNCKGCGISIPEFLSIDHIKPLKLKGHKRPPDEMGYGLYRKLRQLNYPPDYQVLCCNCNYAKRAKSQCPVYGKAHY